MQNLLNPTLLSPLNRLLALFVALMPLTTPTPTLADGGVNFTNIAEDPSSGLNYERAPSADAVIFNTRKETSLIEPISFLEIPSMPYNPQGQPGVAIFDYDGDGDLDIFVTNGPGAAHSLFANQLSQTGETRFVDVAVEAGVAAVDQDGMGTCYGDTDNDGDEDLLVLGRDQPNRFFENQGDGTFARVENSGLEGGSTSSPSCTLGDIDNDGRLDVLIGNSYNHGNLITCMIGPLAEHNQLFRNRGNQTFEDVSAESGLLNMDGLFPSEPGAPTITWAVSMVDVDQDGDADLVLGDDQCAALETYYGGPYDRGFLHVLHNDGTGHFTPWRMNEGPFPSSSWMGLGFGDLDCDGTIDIFGSNFGDYMDLATGVAYAFGQQATRPFFGNGDGTFHDRGVGSIGASVFGWGNAVFDYDNDGDSDVLYHGGMDYVVSVLADNPGALLQNQDCSGEFRFDRGRFDTDHTRRIVLGLAIGDLDRNGYVDVVTASTFDLAPEVPLVLGPAQWGAAFDGTAFIGLPFDLGPAGAVWRGIDHQPGSLAVELNHPEETARVPPSMTVKVVGAAELTDRGRVNRSGIGAVLAFTPDGGPTSTAVVQGGSSFASQHSLETTFGLGEAPRGTLEILWPGGVRNRYDRVRAGQRILAPEIPCDYTAAWPNLGQFNTCLQRALSDLIEAGVLTPRDRWRYTDPQIRAFREHRARSITAPSAR